ncbi:MAG: sensor histidine kinase [Microthrixaceae bacterium]
MNDPTVRNGIVVGIFAGTVVFAIVAVAVDRSLASSQTIANLTFVAVGALLTVRRPGNWIGPLLMWFGLGFEVIGSMGIVVEPLDVSDTTQAWLLLSSETLFALANWPLIAIFALFPHGQVRTRRMRLFLVATFAYAVALAVVSFLATPASIAGSIDDLVHPFVDESTADTMLAVKDAMFAISIVFLLGAAFTNVGKWRRGDAVERRQIGWLAFGGVTYVVVAALNTLVGTEHYSEDVFLLIDAIGVVLIPGAIAIAILRYGLYEIDTIVNRSLIFTTLAAFIGGVYVLIVLGVSRIVGDTSIEASIVATVVVALAFQPVRGRVVQWANRLVYGERATPYQVLQQFARQSAAGTDVDALPRIPELLAAGCGADAATVWIRDADTFRTAALWPDDASDRTLAAAEGFYDPQSDISQPVFHDGELLGGISLSKPSSEPPTPGDEELVRSLASGLGLTLRNNRLTASLRLRLAELEASRERVLAAADDARRALESELDRGAQQTLVAIKVMLGPLRVTAERADAPKTGSLLGQLEEQTGTAISSIREFAAGVYPPLLEAEGLEVALSHRTATAAVPTELSAVGLDRYPREVEAAVYFTVLEALQNTSKYASAHHATVTLSNGGDELRFEVCDDGTGFDVSSAERGAGLSGMADRIDTVGGTIEIISTPGEGTRVAGRIPVWS